MVRRFVLTITACALFACSESVISGDINTPPEGISEQSPPTTQTPGEPPRAPAPETPTPPNNPPPNNPPETPPPENPPPQTPPPQNPPPEMPPPEMPPPEMPPPEMPPQNPPGPVDPNALSFQRDILPIMEAHCTECHDGGRDYNFTTMPLSPAGATLTADLIIQAVNDNRMPPRPRDRMSAADVAKIQLWKDQGAQP